MHNILFFKKKKNKKLAEDECYENRRQNLMVVGARGASVQAVSQCDEV